MSTDFEEAIIKFHAACWNAPTIPKLMREFRGMLVMIENELGDGQCAKAVAGICRDAFEQARGRMAG